MGGTAKDRIRRDGRKQRSNFIPGGITSKSQPSFPSSFDSFQKAYNPLNRAHINIQIKRLFSQVDDTPKDDHLSLEEIQNHAEVFTDMQFFDSDGGSHQEM